VAIVAGWVVGLSVAGLVVDGVAIAAATGTRAGTAEVVKPSSGRPLGGGGSATAFRLKLPIGASCKGDSALAGYRVQSYFVPQAADPGTLAFNSGGPVKVAGEFRGPLFDTFSSSYVDAVTANAITPGGPGQIVQPLPAFDFAVYTPPEFPFTPGIYNVGIACTLGPSSATQQEKYWNTVLTIAADPADTGPAKIRWSLGDVQTTDARASKSPVGVMAIVAGAVLLAIGGGLVFRRRGRDAEHASRPSRSHSAKETR